MASALGSELARRTSLTDEVIAFFKARPLQWINAVELESVGGRQAWRSRVSDARRKLLKAGEGTIENRTYAAHQIERDTERQPARLYLGPVISEYRYRPQAPQGRDSMNPAPEATNRLLFDLHPRG